MFYTAWGTIKQNNIIESFTTYDNNSFIPFTSDCDNSFNYVLNKYFVEKLASETIEIINTRINKINSIIKCFQETTTIIQWKTIINNIVNNQIINLPNNYNLLLLANNFNNNTKISDSNTMIYYGYIVYSILYGINYIIRNELSSELKETFLNNFKNTDIANFIKELE